MLFRSQFVAAPIFANNPLAAFIFGPNYRPLRYTQASEKSWTYIGDYSTAGIGPLTFPWVASNPGAKVDNSASYANITPYLENVFAEYFRGKGITVGGAAGSDATTVVAGSWTDGDDVAVPITISANVYYTNKIRASVLSFAPGVNPSTGAVDRKSTRLNSSH